MIDVRMLAGVAAAAASSRPIPEHPGIYMIVNRVNGWVYVGKSGNMGRRVEAHKQALGSGTHHSKALQADWTTFGAGAFAFAVVTLSSVAGLEDLERECIAQVLGDASYNTSAHSIGRPGTGETPVAQRQRERRARLAKEGGKSMTLILSPAGVAALADLQARAPQQTASALIEAALVEHAIVRRAA